MFRRRRIASIVVSVASILPVLAGGCASSPTSSPTSAVIVIGKPASDEAFGVRTREIEYVDGEVVLRGMLAWPSNADGPVPGVVLVHQWRGRGSHERRRAEMLAELGYAAFVLDMYGDGVFEDDNAAAALRSGAMLADRDGMTRRFTAGWETMKAQPEVDAERTAAIGYCFGGTVVLEVARRGLPLDAVTSFHGTLFFPRTPASGSVVADVLVCNGYLDPVVPAEQRAVFQKQLSDADAAWTFIEYGGAVHAFTDQNVGPYRHGARSAYDPRADQRSWAAMTAQLHDTLGVPAGGARHQPAGASSP
jgi:dienelactone hydrolase